MFFRPLIDESFKQHPRYLAMLKLVKDKFSQYEGFDDSQFQDLHSPDRDMVCLLNSV
jgi:hypothetical protein